MKKLVKILLAVFVFTILINSCSETEEFEDQFCGEFEGHQLYKRPDGECYYIDTDGKLVTVVSSTCDC